MFPVVVLAVGEAVVDRVVAGRVVAVAGQAVEAVALAVLVAAAVAVAEPVEVGNTKKYLNSKA